MNRAILRGGASMAVLASGFAAYGGPDLVNLELRAPFQTVNVGQPVNIGIYAVSSVPGPVDLSGIQMVFSWNPIFLQLNGFTNVGGAWPAGIAGWFPGGGLNEASPPADGNGYFVNLGSTGVPATATSAGILISTLQFTALAATPLTPVDILGSGGSPAVSTKVGGFGTTQGQDITGTLSNAGVEILIPAPATGGLLAIGLLAMGRRRR